MRKLLNKFKELSTGFKVLVISGLSFGCLIFLVIFLFIGSAVVVGTIDAFSMTDEQQENFKAKQEEKRLVKEAEEEAKKKEEEKKAKEQEAQELAEKEAADKKEQAEKEKEKEKKQIEEKKKAEETKVEKKKEPKKEKKVESQKEKPSPEKQLKKALEDSLGDKIISLNGYFDKEPYSIQVELLGSENLTHNMTVTGMKIDVLDAVYAIKELGYEIESFRVSVKYPLVDKYGNTEDQYVIKSDFSGETIGKLADDKYMIDTDNLNIVSDSWWEHPAFTK